MSQFDNDMEDLRTMAVTLFVGAGVLGVIGFGVVHFNGVLDPVARRYQETSTAESAANLRMIRGRIQEVKAMDRRMAELKTRLQDAFNNDPGQKETLTQGLMQTYNAADLKRQEAVNAVVSEVETMKGLGVEIPEDIQQFVNSEAK